RDYPRVPLVVSKNGAALDDVLEDGRVRDEERRAYFEAHLRACREAIGAGVPLEGYFAWPLMDNFEWACGYGKRFGIVRVDYETRERLPRASAPWSAESIRQNRSHEPPDS